MRSTFKVLFYVCRYKAQEDLNVLFEVFPHVADSLRMAMLCKGIGLAVDTIKKLFTSEAVSYSGKLHSQDHDWDFRVQDCKLQLYEEQDKPNKLHLSINGQNILAWFGQKYQGIKHTMNHYTRLNIKPEMDKNKGFKR